MDYIESNKKAWEDAFNHKKDNWGDDNYIKLKSEQLAFVDESMKEEITALDLQGKTIAHFCCNNGRELLSIMKLGVARGVGFDIAENIIEQAKETAAKAEIPNCDFIVSNILDIPEAYHNTFDFIFFTVGAITWFKDLSPLFNKVSLCLKENGKVLINDYHPLENMLAMPSEDSFDPENLRQFSYSYFRTQPWLESDGMDYISGSYASKTFTSFSHTLSSIINSLASNSLKTVLFNEYDYDIGLTDVYDNIGIPLSFTLIAEKGEG